MNHRTFPAARRSTVLASANTSKLSEDNRKRHGHDDVKKLQGANASSRDRSDVANFCAPNQKYKDYQYDRNTVLIGIAVLVIYFLANSQQEIFFPEYHGIQSKTGNMIGTTAVARSSIESRAPDPIPKLGLHDRENMIDDGSDARLQRTIDFPKPPPSLKEDGNASASATNQHLDMQSRSGILVTLVHIGKTGGSALRDLIDYASGYCRINYLHEGQHVRAEEGSLFRDAHLHEKTTLQKHMCALARITNSKGTNNNKNGLIHLDRNLHKTLSDQHFLVPIRNPVHRLVSWFHYERHFQTIKETRYSTALNELIDPNRCNFSTVDEVFLGEKGPSGDINSSQTIKRFELPYGANLPEVVTTDYCYQLSRDCLSGVIPCYGHNFFNYEYYLEDILVRILQNVEAASKNKVNENPQTSHLKTTIIPRVDVIRAERSWDDLNRTLLEWTGLPMTPDMDFFYMNRKPFDVDTHNEDNDKQISAKAARSLCETICPELVAYSKIVKYASNLSPEERASTLTEVGITCGFSIEEVCGKAFRYRKIRDAKQSKLCEPRKKVTNEIETDFEIEVERESINKNNGANQSLGIQTNRTENGLNRRSRRRRLAYLRGNDLPSC